VAGTSAEIADAELVTLRVGEHGPVVCLIVLASGPESGMVQDDGYMEQLRDQDIADYKKRK
jgi:hypothetical protein